MWLAPALGSAVFAALVSVLGKRGLAGVSSNLATVIRSAIALVLAWVLALVSGAAFTVSSLSVSSLIYLLLSGVATGASWLLYFKALKIGRVTQVVAVDRTSLLFTGVFAILFLGESNNLLWKLIGLALVLLGTLVLVGRVSGGSGFAWFWPALGSMGFAVATTLLAKIGLSSVDSTLATAIRTIVVVLFASGIVLARGEFAGVSKLSSLNVWFLVLSGLATGASWLCFFGALKLGQVSLVAPIDKLSIVFAAVLGYFVLRDRVTRKDLGGLALVVIGTLSLLL